MIIIHFLKRHTYRYFEGNERLRHWIYLRHLAIGINTRAEATATALLDTIGRLPDQSGKPTDSPGSAEE